MGKIVDAEVHYIDKTGIHFCSTVFTVDDGLGRKKIVEEAKERLALPNISFRVEGSSDKIVLSNAKKDYVVLIRIGGRQ